MLVKITKALGCETLLQIIFIILKVIGIILASILGLIVAIVLLLLFVPVKYEIYGKIEENVEFRLKVGWLLRIIYFTMSYKNDTFTQRIRLFGIPIRKKNQKTVKKKKNVKRKNTKKETKEKQNLVDVRKEIPDSVHYVKPEEGILKKPEDNKDKTEKDADNKIKGFFIKIKNFFQGILNFIKQSMERLRNRAVNLSEWKNKITLIYDFLQEEQNRIGIKLIWISVKKLAKHCFPKKIKGNITFGTGDPCSTGQLLGFFSLIYGLYGDYIQIIPDFEHSLLLGEIKAKGRLRIFTLLILILKVLFHNDFKKLKYNYNKLKEVL